MINFPKRILPVLLLLVLGCLVFKNVPAQSVSKISAKDYEDSALRPITDSFVKAEEGNFTLNGEKFFFAGTNSYYLPTYEKINDEIVDETLKAFKETGVSVVRIWGFYDGAPEYENDITLQPEPGAYSERNLRHLDEVIAKGKKYDIRFIITLSNFWPELGGMPQYNAWDDKPDGGMSHFIDDPDTQKWFKNYISMLLNRVNTATGVAYKDEPAIFSWEIMNEGRLPDGNPKKLRDWYQEIAKFIKSQDPNHMVTTGEEGFETDIPSEYSKEKYSNNYVLRTNEGTSYKLNTAIPQIDYGTAHWYPANWGFNTRENMLTAQQAWLHDHIKIAEDLDKPFVMGEYGDDNGWGDQKQLKLYRKFWSQAEEVQLDGSLLWQFIPTNTKCYEYGGNICWPGGRKDEDLYNKFRDHIHQINKMR